MSDCTQQCSQLLSKASFLQEAAHHDCMSASMIDLACWLYNCSTVSVLLMHAASPVDAQVVVKDSCLCSTFCQQLLLSALHLQRVACGASSISPPAATHNVFRALSGLLERLSVCWSFTPAVQGVISSLAIAAAEIEKRRPAMLQKSTASLRSSLKVR
jgi:hypothetical protein